MNGSGYSIVEQIPIFGPDLDSIQVLKALNLGKTVLLTQAVEIEDDIVDMLVTIKDGSIMTYVEDPVKGWIFNNDYSLQDAYENADTVSITDQVIS